MRDMRRASPLVLVGVLLCAVALYSALPSRIAPVSLIFTGDTETVLKIVGGRGGDATRTFALPPAPTGERHLGLALRPATYLKAPSGTIEVAVGDRTRCTFRPGDYSDGGTITCPVAQAGATSMRISVKGATGPLALIERQTRTGQTIAGIWVQIAPRSLSGRARFVLTALSTTRAGPFSWPLAILGFVFAVCAGLWLVVAAIATDPDPEDSTITDADPTPATRV